MDQEGGAMDELKEILKKFVDSGWEVIAGPSKDYLDGKCDKKDLVTAIEQADSECGNCGCEYDKLYKKALGLLESKYY